MAFLLKGTRPPSKSAPNKNEVVTIIAVGTMHHGMYGLMLAEYSAYGWYEARCFEPFTLELSIAMIEEEVNEPETA